MEQTKLPLLSICIPTYNRAIFLDKTLDSIVNQKVYKETDEIEIVISDNCSDDETPAIVLKYKNLFPTKIVYHRNSENIRDANFEKVLSLAKGSFLKLNNDTFVHYDGSLNKILDIIRKHEDQHDILFFTNGKLKINRPIYCKTADDFLIYATYWTTWIASFGIWKEDFLRINDFNRFSKLQLAQVDVLFRVISITGKNIYIYNYEIATSLTVPQKGGYDIITVFIHNFSRILIFQKNQNVLTNRAIKIAMKYMLLNHLTPELVRLILDKENHTFKYDNSIIRILNYYKYDPLLICDFFIKYFFLYFKGQLVKIKNNLHNK